MEKKKETHAQYYSNFELPGLDFESGILKVTLVDTYDHIDLHKVIWWRYYIAGKHS